VRVNLSLSKTVAAAKVEKKFNISVVRFGGVIKYLSQVKINI